MPNKIKIFSGRTTEYLAEKIARAYGTELGKVVVTDFCDGEFQPSFEENIEWANKLCCALGVTRMWLWRFISGCDYSNHLEFAYVDKKSKKADKTFSQEMKVIDKPSVWADKLAMKWI